MARQMPSVQASFVREESWLSQSLRNIHQVLSSLCAGEEEEIHT